MSLLYCMTPHKSGIKMCTRKSCMSENFISDQINKTNECKQYWKCMGYSLLVYDIKINFLIYNCWNNRWQILLFWHRDCLRNLFWSITTSPEATPNWCWRLFSALSCWYSYPSLLPYSKIIFILLLLFSLLCLFFQESSIQRFKEPLIKRFSLFLNIKIVWMSA